MRPSRARQGGADWNYVAVHAYGAAEFFEDADRLLDVVTSADRAVRNSRAEAWQVSDAPADFIKAQLRGIVGSDADHADRRRRDEPEPQARGSRRVIAGLGASDNPETARSRR